MTPEEALVALRERGIEAPGWHVRKLEAVGADLALAIPRICRGEPIHRVIGRREFHGLDLALGPETLEPRDDTETLVELALEHASTSVRFADLGTGPGTVGLALLTELSDAGGVLTDASRSALGVAQENADRLGLALRATFAHGSWLEPLAGTFDFIVSNPPYIASAIVDTLDPSVREHDPRLALDGGADGLDAYRAILAGAAGCLKPGGFLAVEIGYDQLASVMTLGETLGWRVEAARKDLGGRDRAVLLRPAGG